jgi:hypothetical protein
VPLECRVSAQVALTVGRDHRRARLGASAFGGPCNGLLHPLLPLESSGVVCLLG